MPVISIPRTLLETKHISNEPIRNRLMPFNAFRGKNAPKYMKAFATGICGYIQKQMFSFSNPQTL